MTDVDRHVAGLPGAAALPRKNGELVFDAPWEGRAFGIAVALNERGAYPWNDFRDRLVAAIGAGRQPYYESWLTALERQLTETGLLAAAELEARAAEFRALERDPVF